MTSDLHFPHSFAFRISKVRGPSDKRPRRTGHGKRQGYDVYKKVDLSFDAGNTDISSTECKFGQLHTEQTCTALTGSPVESDFPIEMQASVA